MIALYTANYIIMLDNLNSHKLADAKVKAKKLGWELFSSHLTSQPEPNGIHQKQVYLNDLLRHMTDMKT